MSGKGGAPNLTTTTITTAAQPPITGAELELTRTLFNLESGEDASKLVFSPRSYIDYILAHDPGRPKYIEFFIEVVDFFKR